MDYLTAPGAALTEGEREWIKETCEALVGEMERPVMVHIGVGQGGSLHCSRAGAPRGRLVGVDLDTSRLVGDADVALIEAASVDAALGFDEEIGFLFIDGDHRFEAVMADIRAWRPLVIGVMAFHDYGNDHLPWCKGVKRAVDACAWDGWEELEAAGSVRAFRKVVGEERPPSVPPARQGGGKKDPRRAGGREEGSPDG